MSLLSKLGLDRREVRAWAMYDWANSAFWSTVITAVFPEFFSVGRRGRTAAGRRHGAVRLITTVALVAIAVMSPILGAIADYAGIRKKMLGAFLALGASATAAMALIGEGDWKLAAALFMLGNIGVTGTIVFYDSLLPYVARPDELDRVSSAGFRGRFPRRRPAPRGQPRLDRQAGVVRAAERRGWHPPVVSERRRSGGSRFRFRCFGTCPSRRANCARAKQRGQNPIAARSGPASARPSASFDATGRRS